MIDEASRMDSGEWLSDEVEEYFIHTLEWDIENETKQNLQNKWKYNSGDEEDFIVPDAQSEEVERSSIVDDWEL